MFETICYYYQPMKKLFILTLLTFLASAAVFGKESRETKRSEILSLISEYSFADGFEVIQVGGIGTKLIKRLIASSVDLNNPEEKAVLDLVKGINKIAIFEYGDCEDSVKERLNRKLDRLLDADNILMDVKSDGTTARIYGMVSDEGNLEDFILHSPEENAVICLFGSLSMDAISRLIED